MDILANYSLFDLEVDDLDLDQGHPMSYHIWTVLVSMCMLALKGLSTIGDKKSLNDC